MHNIALSFPNFLPLSLYIHMYTIHTTHKYRHVHIHMHIYCIHTHIHIHIHIPEFTDRICLDLGNLVKHLDSEC